MFPRLVDRAGDDSAVLEFIVLWLFFVTSRFCLFKPFLFIFRRGTDKCSDLSVPLRAQINLFPNNSSHLFSFVIFIPFYYYSSFSIAPVSPTAVFSFTQPRRFYPSVAWSSYRHTTRLLSSPMKPQKARLSAFRHPSLTFKRLGINNIVHTSRRIGYSQHFLLTKYILGNIYRKI